MARTSKVCDFGLAHLKLDAGVVTSRMGSPMWAAPLKSPAKTAAPPTDRSIVGGRRYRWTAPEVLKGEAATEAADSYSYGMLLYEVLSRELPYRAVPAPQIIVGVMTNLLPRPELPPHLERHGVNREQRCEYKV